MAEPGKKSADGFAPVVPPGNGRQGPSLLEASLASVANLSPATLLPAARREQMLIAIYRLFHAGSAADKAAVEGALMTFFAVHGTSDKTPWAQYPHKIVANGVPVPPNDVVQIIGQGSLKQFLGPYTSVVTQLYEQSAEFRAMMRERVTRAGLAEINGALAIDYVGKDGSLDPASTRLRQVAKNRLLRGSVPLEVLEQSEPPVAREVVGPQTPRPTSNDPFV